ncbi:hypothetical protein KY363_00215, partial [Candidatus Woesearchaeota archaeon]|nr:hypothetical protein [Candidatus Woesearchaeota archaeon]
ERLFIRLAGSLGGTVKVSESLEGKVLDARQYARRQGLIFLIDGAEVFRGKALKNDKGFTLAYDRREDNGRMILLPTGINPYDLKLPEPERSVLRHVLSDHLVEITFTGMIPLQFHSYMNPDSTFWKYWQIPADTR